MRLQDFALERFFARWEFRAEMILCASDLEGWPMRELLELAEPADRRRWDELRLGYTESSGDPALRAEIAGLYDHVSPDDVLVFAGAEEAIFAIENVLLGPGDHAVVVRPAYLMNRTAGASIPRTFGRPCDRTRDSSWPTSPTTQPALS
jgi:DNA-binding transcriptional MocR family regulator